jgi:hypothetical protein
MRCAQDHMKSDERILGDAEFIHFGFDSVKRVVMIAKAEQLGLVVAFRLSFNAGKTIAGYL